MLQDSNGKTQRTRNVLLVEDFRAYAYDKHESESFYLPLRWILFKVTSRSPCSLSWRKLRCRWRWELASTQRRRGLPKPALFERGQLETTLQKKIKKTNFVLKLNLISNQLCHRLKLRIARNDCDWGFGTRVVLRVECVNEMINSSWENIFRKWKNFSFCSKKSFLLSSFYVLTFGKREKWGERRESVHSLQIVIKSDKPQTFTCLYEWRWHCLHAKLVKVFAHALQVKRCNLSSEGNAMEKEVNCLVSMKKRELNKQMTPAYPNY